ncbi:MAG: ribonuclease PH [Thermoleophilia bacterium]|nr:ribonuclease PH [Thermoleophilia bacterium]
MQRRHLRCAPRSPGGAPRARRRRDRARGARRRAGDPQPPRRPARHRGDRRRGTLRAPDPRARRRRRRRPGGLPTARPADRGRRPVRARDGRRRARVRGAAPRGVRRHRYPRVHPLPAHPPDPAAGVRARGHARLLGGGDGARDRRDPGPQGDRERPRAPRQLPLRDDRRARGVPRDGRALPPVADRRGGAGGARTARGRRRVKRSDGRHPAQLRAVTIDTEFLEQPHGVALLSQGRTRVLCTATVEDGVPRWLKGRGRGWITAEYSLLPASTGARTDREAARGRQGGRTVEIQRLIGRAVRAVADFEALGERTVWLDCDVLQADGGTRSAAITGAYVAARRALDRFGLGKALREPIAAVSVGVVDGVALLDLDYGEDSRAEVDMNVAMAPGGRLIEVQATAEAHPFSRELLDELLDLAARGVELLVAAQDRSLEAAVGT